MSASQPDPRFPSLAHQASDLSTSSALLDEHAPGPSLLQHRTGYARVNSSDPADKSDGSNGGHHLERERDLGNSFHAQGLGIASQQPPPPPSYLASSGPQTAIPRVVIESKTPPLRSPSSLPTTPSLSSAPWAVSPRIEYDPQFGYISEYARDGGVHRSHPSVSSMHTDAHQPYAYRADPEHVNLLHSPSIPSQKSAYDCMWRTLVQAPLF